MFMMVQMMPEELSVHLVFEKAYKALKCKSIRCFKTNAK
jgi:hypothetical protein